MADFYGGAGGLFSGLSQGLQIILALRQAAENQRIARERTGLMRNQDTREQAAMANTVADAPYEDIQGQLNKMGVIAGREDVRREYEPPADASYEPVGETFKPLTSFQPPAFGGPKPPQSSPAPVPNLETSHIAQVLERAKRSAGAGHLAKVDALTRALGVASGQAQETQRPVTEGLPTGFTATPDKTFTPYQLSGRPDPLDNIFGPLLNNPIGVEMLKVTDPITYQQFLKWKTRRVGGGADIGGAGADPNDPQPGETVQQYADRVGPILGGAEARKRWLAKGNR